MSSARIGRICTVLAAAVGVIAVGLAPASAASPSHPRPPAPRTTWDNVEVVGGGFVPGIVYNATEPGLVYARTDIGGAYRLDTTTKRWVPLLDFLGSDDWNLMGVDTLATDPVNPNNLYVLGGAYTQSWAGNAALFRSGDRGVTFSRVDLPFKSGGNENGRSMGERLQVDPHDNNILYLGTRNDGMWRSEDAGLTWARLASFPVTGDAGIGVSFIEVDAATGAAGAPSPVVYAGVADKAGTIYRSTDAGATWALLPGQPTGWYAHHGRIGADGVLYVTYGDGASDMNDGGVWTFVPGTGAWRDITPLRPNVGAETGFGYAGLAVDAQRPGTVMVATLDRWNPGDDIFRSTDGGATWRSISATKILDISGAPYLSWHKTPKLGWWIGDLEIDPFNSERAMFGTGATIFGTDNLSGVDNGGSTTWSVRAQGLEETSVQDLASPTWGQAHLFSALGDIGSFRHADLSVVPPNGMDANPIFGTATSIEYARLRSGFLVRAGGSDTQRVAYTFDDGTTWKPFATEPAGVTKSGKVVTSPDGSTVIWSGTGGPAHLTSDLGTSWTEVTGLPAGVEVTADRADSRQFYAFDSATGTAYVSHDSGRTFIAAQTGLPIGQGKLEAVIDRRGDVWLAAGGAGLWRSTDGGLRYTQVTSGVSAADNVAFGKAAPGARSMAVYLNGVVGGQRGVFRSDDASATWVRVNDDNHQWGWTGSCLGADPRVYGRVFVCTNGRGIQVGELARR